MKLVKLIKTEITYGEITKIGTMIHIFNRSYTKTKSYIQVGAGNNIWMKF